MNDNKIVALKFDEHLSDRDTSAAVLLRFDTKHVWLAKSLIAQIDDDVGVVLCKAWIVHEKGLEGYIDDGNEYGQYVDALTG